MSQHTLISAALACAAATLGFAASAATPSSGTLSPESRSITFTGGPLPIPNVTPQLYVEGIADPVCVPGAPICDVFDLTLDLPDDYFTTNPTDVVRIKMSWTATVGAEDWDFYMYDSAGNIVNQGEGTTNPETITFCAGEKLQNYQLQIYPFSALASTYEVTIDMQPEDRARCKAPKAEASAGKAGGQFGGAFGFALLVPLFGLLALRRSPRA